MNWRFWQKRDADDYSEDAYEGARERAKRDGCFHDWTNWSSPQQATIPVYSMFAAGDATREASVQSRVCLKCNMHERRSF